MGQRQVSTALAQQEAAEAESMIFPVLLVDQAGVAVDIPVLPVLVVRLPQVDKVMLEALASQAPNVEAAAAALVLRVLSVALVGLTVMAETALPHQ
tara:strand:+ start:221 stop:508 length:288 start_codon:yes stop_codon:yes gene_type:complete